jgi:hypothetical protein
LAIAGRGGQTAQFIAPSSPGQFADKISSPTRESVAKLGEQRMWLDLLVASGLGLPAIFYGSLLFVNYMQ